MYNKLYFMKYSKLFSQTICCSLEDRRLDMDMHSRNSGSEVLINLYHRANELCFETLHYLPVSHKLPVNPRAQSHRYLLTRFRHFPLFLHGELSHSLMSEI